MVVHYIVYMNSCGSGSCVIYSIADVNTGKIIPAILNVFMGDVDEQYTPSVTLKIANCFMLQR